MVKQFHHSMIHLSIQLNKRSKAYVWGCTGQREYGEIIKILKENSRRLDGNATILFILACIGEPGLSGLGSRNNSSFGHERVGQSRLAVIHVGDYGHVADVPLLVHHRPDLVHGKVHLEYENDMSAK